MRKKYSKEELQEIRFENFHKLVEEAGGVSKLSRTCGYNKPTYFYQLNSRRAKANGEPMNLGSNVCAKLEKAMKKPVGWMSRKHREAEEATVLESVQNTEVVSTQTATHNFNDAVNSETTPIRLPKLSPIDVAAPKNNFGTITLAWTGASGFAYGLRLLECLLLANIRVNLVYSDAARSVAMQEAQLVLPDNAAHAQQMLCERFKVSATQLCVYAQNDWFAPIASGSYLQDGMVICPSSMGTLASLAHGLSDNLLERAADVCIKEKRPVIIVPRETPLSPIHLENMLKLANAGCTILPPVAGFYHNPQSIADVVDFVVARILDQLRVPHSLSKRWGD